MLAWVAGTFTTLAGLAAVVLAHEDAAAGIDAEPRTPGGSMKEPLQWRASMMPFAYPVVVGLLEALVQVAQKGAS